MIKVQNNLENKNVSVLLKEASVAYPEDPAPVRPDAPVRMNRIKYCKDILGFFSKHCIMALEKRMQACTENLYKHKDSIIFNNGHVIIYKREDGTRHSYNISSVTTIEAGIKRLEMLNLKTFLQDRGMVDQLLKALYWVEKPEDKKGCYKYSDLLSMLMEIHMLGCPKD